MKRYAMPRTSYLPASIRHQEPMVPEGTDLAIWTWMENERPYAIAFQGKADKPLWHYRFVNTERRAQKINETVKSRLSSLAYKAAQMEARKNFQHDLRVSDILSASWGYDQTNVDFYEVVRIAGKAVVVRKVAGKIVKSDGCCDYVVACPGSFIGEELRRLPNKYGVKIDDCRRASKWDGKPEYQTNAMCGH